MSKLIRKAWTSHAKWGVALLGLATTLLNMSLVHGTALQVTQVVVALLTAEGVRQVPNAPETAPGD